MHSELSFRTNDYTQEHNSQFDRLFFNQIQVDFTKEMRYITSLPSEAHSDSLSASCGFEALMVGRCANLKALSDSRHRCACLLSSQFEFVLHRPP